MSYQLLKQDVLFYQRFLKSAGFYTGLLDGQLAWRQHDGGHTDAPNMKYFIRWADSFINHAHVGAP